MEHWVNPKSSCDKENSKVKKTSSPSISTRVFSRNQNPVATHGDGMFGRQPLFIPGAKETNSRVMNPKDQNGFGDVKYQEPSELVVKALYKAVVVHIENHNEFYIIKSDDSNTLEKISSQLKKFDSQLKQIYTPFVGRRCVARAPDGKLFRAIVTSRDEYNQPELMAIDIGFKLPKADRKTYFLPKDLEKNPPLAYKCRIGFYNRPPGYGEDFKRSFENKTVILEIIGGDVQSGYCVKVVDYSLLKGEDRVTTPPTSSVTEPLNQFNENVKSHPLLAYTAKRETLATPASSSNNTFEDATQAKLAYILAGLRTTDVHQKPAQLNPNDGEDQKLRPVLARDSADPQAVSSKLTVVQKPEYCYSGYQIATTIEVATPAPNTKLLVEISGGNPASFGCYSKYDMRVVNRNKANLNRHFKPTVDVQPLTKRDVKAGMPVVLWSVEGDKNGRPYLERGVITERETSNNQEWDVLKVDDGRLIEGVLFFKSAALAPRASMWRMPTRFAKQPGNGFTASISTLKEFPAGFLSKDADYEIEVGPLDTQKHVYPVIRIRKVGDDNDLDLTQTSVPSVPVSPMVLNALADEFDFISNTETPQEAFTTIKQDFKNEMESDAAVEEDDAIIEVKVSESESDVVENTLNEIVNIISNDEDIVEHTVHEIVSVVSDDVDIVVDEELIVGDLISYE